MMTSFDIVKSVYDVAVVIFTCTLYACELVYSSVSVYLRAFTGDQDRYLVFVVWDMSTTDKVVALLFTFFSAYQLRKAVMSCAPKVPDYRKILKKVTPSREWNYVVFPVLCGVGIFSGNTPVTALLLGGMTTVSLIELHDFASVEEVATVEVTVTKVQPGFEPAKEMATSAPVTNNKIVPSYALMIGDESDGSFVLRGQANYVRRLDDYLIVTCAHLIWNWDVEKDVPTTLRSGEACFVRGKKLTRIPYSAFELINGDIAVATAPANIGSNMGLKAVNVFPLAVNREVGVTAVFGEIVYSSLGRVMKRLCLHRFFNYTASTQPGWSGSGVMQDGKIVGIHVGADPKLNNNHFASLYHLCENAREFGKRKKIESATNTSDSYEDDDYNVADFLESRTGYASKRIKDDLGEEYSRFTDFYAEDRFNDFSNYYAFKSELIELELQGYTVNSKESKAVRERYYAKIERREQAAQTVRIKMTNLESMSVSIETPKEDVLKVRGLPIPEQQGAKKKKEKKPVMEKPIISIVPKYAAPAAAETPKVVLLKNPVREMKIPAETKVKSQAKDQVQKQMLPSSSANVNTKVKQENRNHAAIAMKPTVKQEDLKMFSMPMSQLLPMPTMMSLPPWPVMPPGPAQLLPAPASSGSFRMKPSQMIVEAEPLVCYLRSRHVNSSVIRLLATPEVCASIRNAMPEHTLERYVSGFLKERMQATAARAMEDPTPPLPPKKKHIITRDRLAMTESFSRIMSKGL
jgi:hypothetical protein